MRSPVVVEIAVLITLAACGTTGATAARVGDRTITDADVEHELAHLAANKSYVAAVRASGVKVDGPVRGSYDLAFVDLALTNLAVAELVHGQFEENKGTLTTEDVAVAEREAADAYPAKDGVSIFAEFSPGYRHTLARRRAQSDSVKAHAGQVDIREPALRAFYDRQPGAFLQMVCLRQILLTAPDPKGLAQANSVVLALKAGNDFAALARQESADPASAAAGGSLGCTDGAGIGRFEAPFAAAVRGLQVDQISPPIRTKDGWRVIQITSESTAPYDDAARTVARSALLAPAAGAYDAVITDRMTRLGVEISARFGRWDVSDPSHPHVVPPPATAPAAAPPTTSAATTTPTTTSTTTRHGG